MAVVDVRPLNERGEWFIPDSIHVDAYDALWAGDMSSLAAIELPPRARLRVSRQCLLVIRPRRTAVFTLKPMKEGVSCM